MKTPKIAWYGPNGFEIQAAHSFTKAFIAAIKAQGWREIAHFRIGDFSICTTSAGPIVGPVYRGVHNEPHSADPASDIYPYELGHLRDRRALCRKIIQILPRDNPYTPAVVEQAQIELVAIAELIK